MMDIEKLLAATAIAAAMALPTYAPVQTSPEMARTSFEKQSKFNEAIFMAPGAIGLLSAGRSNLIQSVQNVTVTIAAGATSGTASISNVTTGSAVAELNGMTTAATSAFDYLLGVSVQITSSTQVTVTTNTADATNARTISVTVTEYRSGALRSNVQSTITLSAATSNTATVSSVTTGNSVVVHQGQTTATSSSAAGGRGNVVLTNSTTVTAACGVSASYVQYYTLLEFNSGILNSGTQAFSIALSTAQTTNTATLSSVTANKSKVFWNGMSLTNTGNTTAVAGIFPWLTQTNGTTNTATRGNAGASNGLTVLATLVEFKSADITSINRGSVVIASGSASNTATFSAVNTAKAAMNMVGFTASTTGGNNRIDGIWPKINLTNSTTTTATTNATIAIDRTVGYEVVEYS